MHIHKQLFLLFINSTFSSKDDDESDDESDDDSDDDDSDDVIV